MTATQALLRLAQTGQALALAGKNLKLVEKKDIKAKDLIKAGATNIVGIELLKAQGKLI